MNLQLSLRELSNLSFQKLVFSHSAKFNSATSLEFLEHYEAFQELLSKESRSHKSSRTFAPSSFRCSRIQWFRFRGVDPDVPENVDVSLDFAADIGTACHRIIQSNLKNMLKDDWIYVDEYVSSILNGRYECMLDEESGEYFVKSDDPPVKFACDGLIRWNGEFYLLEIKTSEFNSWNNLSEPKPYHIDQVKMYCTLLDLNNVMFIYQDRHYGGLKCYEYKVRELDKQTIRSKMDYIQDCVETGVAPNPLPKGDRWCTPSMCPYYTKCSEYGRYES